MRIPVQFNSELYLYSICYSREEKREGRGEDRGERGQERGEEMQPCTSGLQRSTNDLDLFSTRTLVA